MTDPRLQKVYDGWNKAGVWVTAHPKTTLAVFAAVIAVILLVLVL